MTIEAPIRPPSPVLNVPRFPRTVFNNAPSGMELQRYGDAQQAESILVTAPAPAPSAAYSRSAGQEAYVQPAPSLQMTEQEAIARGLFKPVKSSLVALRNLAPHLEAARNRHIDTVRKQGKRNKRYVDRAVDYLLRPWCPLSELGSTIRDAIPKARTRLKAMQGMNRIAPDN